MFINEDLLINKTKKKLSKQNFRKLKHFKSKNKEW